MHSLWRDHEADEFIAAAAHPDLGARIYSSRLLGRDKTLVLHGGGNTSVKMAEVDRFGDPRDVLYVKGSGWDLEFIEAAGFTPVKLAHAKRLAELARLSDPDMVNELITNTIRAGAPNPSVETILHALLPYKFVDHTHADAVLTITDTTDGEARIRALYGASVVVLPYVFPGFDLARAVAREFALQATPNTIGMVLVNHGVFSFGATARESYEHMIDLVNRAEGYLHDQGAANVIAARPRPAAIDAVDLSALREQISHAAGRPMILRTRTTAQSLAFAGHAHVHRISQQGPATPDHVIRTKQTPLVGTDVEQYAAEYREYFAQHVANTPQPKTMLDPAPRVVLDPRFGMASVGRTVTDAKIVEDLYEHTIDIIVRAEALGGYRALPSRDIFAMEYWDLEQAKLRKGGSPPPFQGEVALVTGAASGIGRASVHALLSRGAAVIGLDLNADIESMFERADFLGLALDITNEGSLVEAIRRGVLGFGGIDMLILNAGIFGASAAINALASDEWRRVMAVNVDANLALMRGVHPYLKRAPRGGRVLVIGSKNVPAPGPGAAAYSASKAALNQLVRVAALEWGTDNIRVNTIHPNQVFDTGLWTDELIAVRAKHHGLTSDAYKTNNVLQVEVTSRDVAELAAEMCGALFAKTTGAQIPVDGGNDRVI